MENKMDINQQPEDNQNQDDPIQRLTDNEIKNGEKNGIEMNPENKEQNCGKVGKNLIFIKDKLRYKFGKIHKFMRDKSLYY